MIREEQEKWIDHLDATDSVEMFPYDSTSPEKFERIKKLLISVLGTDAEILHRGSSGLGIKGQKEIDIYIPVAQEFFNKYITPLEQIFGTPRSHYPLERVCFVSTVDGTKAEIFVINKEVKSWIDGSRFEEHLRRNTEALNEYTKLKDECHGLSTRTYYRKKTEFINDLLSRIDEKIN